MSTCETAALLSVYFERIVICGFITHDGDIAQMADRIVRIEDGKIRKGSEPYAGK